MLSESMQPGFYRGDILFLYQHSTPVRTGEIVVFNLPHKRRPDGQDLIPIVHRAIQIHQPSVDGEIKILTKGRNLERATGSRTSPNTSSIRVAVRLC